MRNEGAADKERFGKGRLIIWPCEEEVAIALEDGSSDERYYRGICDMERGEDSESV